MDYEKELERLIDHNPQSSILWLLRSGDTPGNRLLLSRALKDVPEEPVTQEPEPAEEPDPVDDETLRVMRIELSKRYAERAKESNKFHDCTNDQQRATVSDSINSIQRRIEHIRLKIEHYKQIGTLPKDDEKYPIPEDGVKLINLRNSLRSNISIKRKTIIQLARDLQAGDPSAAEKIGSVEAKLKEKEMYLAHVQKHIKNRNLQSD